MPKCIIQNVNIYHLDISKHNKAWGSVQKVPVEKQSDQIKFKDNITLTEVALDRGSSYKGVWIQRATCISKIWYISNL